MMLSIYSKTGNSITKEKQHLLKKLRQLSEEVSRQYALYYYLWLVKEAKLSKLHRVYNEIAGRVVSLNTVRKQLKILERKGLVKRCGDVYVALLEPKEALNLFDSKRSRACRKGALKRAIGANRRREPVPLGLAHYVKQIIDEARKLIDKGDRTAALDILVHTILTPRETETLWLWHRNVFIYCNTKSNNFRAVESKEVADLFRKLGYKEGIMIFHILEHEKAKEVLHKIFNRGPYTWPWARSISYGLKELGLLKETTNFRIQIKKVGTKIELVLWNLYTKQEICNYSINWNYEVPEPLKNRTYYAGTVLGKQHVKQEIEIDSYFSKWRM